MSERCEICGLVYETITAPDAIVALNSFPRRYREVFAAVQDEGDVDSLVRERPEPATWSALEYAAHVRGVVQLFDERVRRALVEDSPEVPGSALDENPWEGHEPGDDLAVVLDGLTAACHSLVARLEGVQGEDWNRTVVREGEEISVLWMARNTVHEGAHHLRDIEKVLRAVS